MTLPRLPGPCVAVPLVKNQVSNRDGTINWEVETHHATALDLDGHGSPVMLVPPTEDGLETDDMYWTLYIMRGDCGHDVGIVAGLEDPTPEEGFSHGLRNISTLRPSGSPDEERPRGNLVLTRYEFDGQRYRAGKPKRR